MRKNFHNPLSERLDEEFFASLPKKPGVYFMRSIKGEILYVGKATNLRTRVSSYRHAKPGAVGRNILKLVQLIDHITWEEHESEQCAYEREREIIRALVPRYNIADAWEESYFFIGLKQSEGKIEFRLSSNEKNEDSFDLHGCYPGRRLAKQGYAALLRLLYAATRTENKNFSFPAILARPAPAYRYTLKLQKSLEWKVLISDFLHGRNSELLSSLVTSLLGNFALPEYTRPALQRDIETLKSFDAACLSSRRTLALAPGELSTHRSLRKAIRDSLSPEI